MAVEGAKAHGETTLDVGLSFLQVERGKDEGTWRHNRINQRTQTHRL